MTNTAKKSKICSATVQIQLGGFPFMAVFCGFFRARWFAWAPILAIVVFIIFLVFQCAEPSDPFQQIAIGMNEEQLRKVAPGVMEISSWDVPMRVEDTTTKDVRIVSGEKFMLWTDKSSYIYVGLSEGFVTSKHKNIRGN